MQIHKLARGCNNRLSKCLKGFIAQKVYEDEGGFRSMFGLDSTVTLLSAAMEESKEVKGLQNWAVWFIKLSGSVRLSQEY